MARGGKRDDSALKRAGAHAALTPRGYGVAKDALTPEELERVRAELTVSPVVPKDFAAVSRPACFKLFVESPSKIYVPKAYGLAAMGAPAQVKLQEGEPIDLAFAGRLRPEQETPVANLLAACRDPARMGGILNVFCGGGKTTMALYAACALGRKTLIVVHKDFLLQQWKERIEGFVPGARVGLIKAKKIQVENCDIVLASLQSLSMKEYAEDVLAGFGTVIIDEVHHTSAEVFSQALRKMCFRYTVGLTATIDRKDGLTKVFVWYLGDVVFRATKRVDTVRVAMHEYYDPCPDYSFEHTLFGDKPNISRMINNICAYEPRARFVIDRLAEVLEREPGRKVLVLSDRRAHLEAMQRLMRETRGWDAGLYYGGLPQEVLAQSEDKRIILATFAIAAEGYDQQGLDTLVLASPKSDVVQAVGRILRDKPCDRKHECLVIDIVDAFSLFERQGAKRRKYYRTMGYTLGDGCDDGEADDDDDENDEEVDADGDGPKKSKGGKKGANAVAAAIKGACAIR